MSDRTLPDDTVAEFIRDSDGMPNRREALRPGTLPGTFADPQGDENRDPPCPPTPPPVFPSSPQTSVDCGRRSASTRRSGEAASKGAIHEHCDGNHRS